MVLDHSGYNDRSAAMSILVSDMNEDVPDREAPAETLDVLAEMLVRQAASLSRVMFRRIECRLSRTEVGLLARLEAGPLRITALAGLDGLAQPTVTTLVNRLEDLGLVGRGSLAGDGRVVMVSLTEAGWAEINTIRLAYRDLLRGYLDDLPIDDLAAIKPAIHVMATLVQRLQSDEA